MSTVPSNACTYHCATCGRHFASLTAFDRHRQGPWDDRRCVDPEGAGMTGLVGTCKLASSKSQEGTVWTTRSTE